MTVTRGSGLADFASGLGDTLTIDSNNGRVGINSTSPRTALDVVGVVSATSFYGSGANLTDVISGVELKQDGSSVGTSITAINFSGATVSSPVSGISTVTIAKQLTIGVRAGAAVTFGITGSSFNVSGRSGNVSIDL